jgi:hypothetical protein
LTLTLVFAVLDTNKWDLPLACEGICIGFESTEGPAGSLAGAQEKSVAKSTTSKPTIAQGTKESSAAESAKQKSSVAPSGHGES